MGAFNKTDFNDSNVNAAKAKLLNAKFPLEYVNNFKFIFWDIPNSHYGNSKESTKFETYGNVPNVYYFGGYDGAIVSFLTGQEGKAGDLPKNAEELFLAAMDQEVLKMVSV
jgi:hypothetical protein